MNRKERRSILTKKKWREIIKREHIDYTCPVDQVLIQQLMNKAKNDDIEAEGIRVTPEYLTEARSAIILDPSFQEFYANQMIEQESATPVMSEPVTDDQEAEECDD